MKLLNEARSSDQKERKRQTVAPGESMNPPRHNPSGWACNFTLSRCHGSEADEDDGI